MNVREKSSHACKHVGENARAIKMEREDCNWRSFGRPAKPYLSEMRIYPIAGFSTHCSPRLLFVRAFFRSFVNLKFPPPHRARLPLLSIQHLALFFPSSQLSFLPLAPTPSAPHYPAPFIFHISPLPRHVFIFTTLPATHPPQPSNLLNCRGFPSSMAYAFLVIPCANPIDLVTSLTTSLLVQAILYNVLYISSASTAAILPQRDELYIRVDIRNLEEQTRVCGSDDSCWPNPCTPKWLVSQWLHR